ncbi:hypothetical protein AB4Y63_03750 [Leifsonia sp. YAF41]|uniref:hypothetical protein n=1 Tax=Leifsonia sp. YAF41 TaxID=3233086 RepID=UPI003F989C4F
MRRHSFLTVTLAVMGLTAGLTACTAGPVPTTSDSAPTSPATSTPSPTSKSETAGAWQQQFLDGGDNLVRWGDDVSPHIILSTYGSGTCPTTPATLELTNSTTITVTLAPPPTGPCTADYRRTSFAAEQPQNLDLSQVITVIVDGKPYGTLPALTS